MPTLSPETTVGEFVAQRPALSRLFERLGIDYCCGGRKPLAQACRERGLDAGTVFAMLEAAVAPVAPGDEINAAAMTLTELADHIEETHHAYLKHELPRLRHMALRVANAHGQRLPWTNQLAQVVEGFVSELQSHMMKEEQILFPLVRQIDAAEEAQEFHCGSLANPIRVMEAEHQEAGDALATMRTLTSDYTPPEGACNTFRALLDGLKQLEADMHQHVHRENNILFPRALEREAALAG